MWVPRVIYRFWAAFSVHAQSPALVPFCVSRATRHNTPYPSPMPDLGFRLDRGHFSVTAKKFGCFGPPSETPSEFLIRGNLQNQLVLKHKSDKQSINNKHYGDSRG